jgi:hypothetical protein
MRVAITMDQPFDQSRRLSPVAELLRQELADVFLDRLRRDPARPAD